MDSDSESVLEMAKDSALGWRGALARDSVLAMALVLVLALILVLVLTLALAIVVQIQGFFLLLGRVSDELVT